MTAKPDTCRPCPLYDDGKGFVPGWHVEGSTILLLGQNPGEEEERQGRPLVGKTGQWMDDQLLPLAGLDPATVSRDNVIRCRWRKAGKKTNDLPPDAIINEAMVQCQQYDTDMSRFDTVVAMGRVAAWKMHRSPLKVHEWRGHLLPGKENEGGLDDGQTRTPLQTRSVQARPQV